MVDEVLRAPHSAGRWSISGVTFESRLDVSGGDVAPGPPAPVPSVRQLRVVPSSLSADEDLTFLPRRGWPSS
jgi:hypothetical protein